MAEGILVVPCVEDLSSYLHHTPDSLHPFNGVEWGPGPAPRQAVVHILLEQLGLDKDSLESP